MPRTVCMHPTCTVEISPLHLMCITHFKRLPQPVAKEIQKLLHNKKNQAEGIAFLRAYLDKETLKLRGVAS